MPVRCVMMAVRVTAPMTSFGTRDFPNVPRIGEVVRLVDGDLKMHFVVKGVQYTPDDPVSEAEAIILIEEIADSRDGAYRNFLTPP